MIYHIYCKDGQKMARPIQNRQELMNLRNSAQNLENLDKARKGDAQAKSSLVQLAYNLGYADGLLTECHSMGSYFFYDVDCYNKAETELIRDLVMSKKDEIGLKMLERSASGGWHLVCSRERGKTILESTVRVSIILKLEMDTGVKDLHRVVFSTSGSAEDLPYLDDALFEEPMSAEECAEEYRLTKARELKKQEDVPAGALKSNKHYKPWEDPSAGSGTAGKKKSPSWTSQAAKPSAAGSGTVGKAGSGAGEKQDLDDVEPISPEEAVDADERTRFIFRECMKEEGVEETDLTEAGGRHNSVKMVLSCCTQLLSAGEVLGVLKELMPKNWSDENIRQLVADFYSKYYDANQRLTAVQKRIFRASRKIGRKEVEKAEETVEVPAENQSELSKLFASPVPPKMPAKLPKLITAITSQTPKKYKPTVAQAIFPSLATYPRDLSFVYIDNQVRELRINCLIVAGTGSGKDSCMTQPLNHILADMKQRDQMNRERLEKFNEEYESKANNKEKPKRPTDLIIQTLVSDVTKAALVQRMKEAKHAPLYVRMNELEQWDKVEGLSGRSNHFTTMKMLDDENNEFGSERAGTQSVTGRGNLHLNFNANTTTAKAIKYFRHVLTDGPISRLSLATIPDEDIGQEISVFGTYDEAYDEALKPYIENLKAATGVIDCPQAKKLARKLMHECMEFARLSQDRVFDNLTHRALVLAFRKACLLYAANGMKWEKQIEDFCRWSLFYDLYLKMTIWGDLIRHADDDVPTSKRGPRNLLEVIPTNDEGIFTFQDAVKARIKNGMPEDGTNRMLSQWKFRGYILQITDYSFKKAQYGKRRKIKEGAIK